MCSLVSEVQVKRCLPSSPRKHCTARVCGDPVKLCSQSAAIIHKATTISIKQGLRHCQTGLLGPHNKTTFFPKILFCPLLGAVPFSSIMRLQACYLHALLSIFPFLSHRNHPCNSPSLPLSTLPSSLSPQFLVLLPLHPHSAFDPITWVI